MTNNVFITGGSRGIGAAAVLAFARAGYNVAFTYNSHPDAADAVRRQAEEINPGGLYLAIRADAGDPAQVRAAVARAEQELGSLQVLVCNAGITKDNLLMRMKESEWDDVIDTDLSSLFYCAKEAVRPMLKSRWGRIIAITSVNALRGGAGQCNYAAAKAGMIGFIKSLAREVAAKGITANAIAPGFIETDMTAVLSDELKGKFVESIPAGRAGTPRDVAGAAVFLASENASYIQGQVIAVDGGITM